MPHPTRQAAHPRREDPPGSGPRRDMTPAPRPEGLRPAGSRPARTREPHVVDTPSPGPPSRRHRPHAGTAMRWPPADTAPDSSPATVTRRLRGGIFFSRLNQDGRILARPQLPRPHMKKEHDRAHSAGYSGGQAVSNSPGGEQDGCPTARRPGSGVRRGGWAGRACQGSVVGHQGDVDPESVRDVVVADAQFDSLGDC